MGANGNSVGVVETHVADIPLSDGGLLLECGQRLPELRVAYEAYGAPAPDGGNVVFICHALSGDAHAAGWHARPGQQPGWWDEMIGPGKGIDTDYYHVICANVLGGCRGTTGPSSINPAGGRPYGSAFPRITVSDIVNVHRLLLAHLGFSRVAALIGGSFGGMQALDWAIRFPDSVDRVVCIASSVGLSTQALAFDIVGRKAITFDPNWQQGDYYGTDRRPDNGLSLARKIGHITYLSPGMMRVKFGRERVDGGADAPAFHSTFQVERYLEHQGRKFVDRFDANSYLHITAAMDEFDLAERYGGLERAFAPLRAKCLVVALSSDWLFPPEQSVEIANALLRAGKAVSYCLLQAPHGHDAFLIEVEHLGEAIRAFLPWVHSRAGAGRPPPESARREFAVMADMIRPGSRVLDLGCGEGELLSLLETRRGTRGFGVDIAIAHLLTVLDRGHDIFQADIDAGLAMIPDGAYDYAVLSETLHVVRHPRLVLREMLRVAREGIVSFPNFGHWRRRLDLALFGRLPRAGGHAWYDTPNSHPFTYRDFAALCREEGIRILRVAPLTAGPAGRALCALGACALGADRVIVHIA
jgi:homoserine O-acetyltransferase/O-succinyltransferase